MQFARVSILCTVTIVSPLMPGNLSSVCTGQTTHHCDDLDLLWHNGFDYFYGGMSVLTGKGVRRSVLDDFVVPESGWQISHLQAKLGWGDSAVGAGVDFELVFYRDANGRPNFDQPVAAARNRVYHEELDPTHPQWRGIPVVIASVDFDPISMEPGVYWVDMLVVRPELVSGYFIMGTTPQFHGSEVWVDYSDFGGRMPGSAVFGMPFDASFILSGAGPCGALCPYHPQEISIEHGAIRSGTIEDLQCSDDESLVLEPRPAFTVAMPVIRIEADTFLDVTTTTELEAIVETSSDALPRAPWPRLHLFNVDDGTWEGPLSVDGGDMGVLDVAFRFRETSNPDRFITPDTGTVRLRIEYFDPGNIIRPSWIVRIDQARLAVTP